MKKILVAMVAIAGIIVAFVIKNKNEFNPVNVDGSAPVFMASNTKSSKDPLRGINIKKLIMVASANGLQPKVLKAALNSYAWAREHGKLGGNQKTLTVVDFTLPSYNKRMWVLDLQANKVLMTLYTTHGKGSGLAYANRFSNQGSSNTSSLGLYVTSDIYYGKHDKSMRIDGLEKGINDNARARDIVIHAAPYATPEYVQQHHLAGRSWGCYAVAPEVKEELLGYIKGGSALFAYAAPEDKDPIVKNGPIAI